jgi:starch phosphorylase
MSNNTALSCLGTEGIVARVPGGDNPALRHRARRADHRDDGRYGSEVPVLKVMPTRRFFVEPALPPALEPLRELATNYRWTWDPDTIALFERLDRELWHASGHNPATLLRQVSPDVLDRRAGDARFLEHLASAHARFAAYRARPPQLPVPATPAEPIAYFSFEFALAESLAMYSGGLGVLAGDHLKSASDLGLPLVGVSLLFREGYFHQTLAADGRQREEYHPVDPYDHAIRPVRDEAGVQIRVAVPFPGRDVWAALWLVQVGSIQLYLLDTRVAENSEADRGIGDRLYGGDADTRIAQEMVLGIGGYRALRALGMRPSVCHMNEGHSSLMAIERTRVAMEEGGASFEEARVAVQAATVFTTHTAVAAGIDLFAPELVTNQLRSYYSRLGLDDRAFLGLGRMDASDDGEPFSMALLGLRMSGFRNGVSRLHGGVSRTLWERAWPGLPAEQVPIGSVTNGVHLPSWVSHQLGALYDRQLGPAWRDDPTGAVDWAGLSAASDHELWDLHVRQRHILVERARHHSRETAARQGLSRSESGERLDPDVLTIGFARRFAAYKRATLLFRDPDRLAKILNHSERPIQVVFAGKAHPRDEGAKQLIQEVVAHSRRPELRDRLVVLERYDLELARTLVQGCDVWLNTPLRPMEASGTSGMKAVANGALHVSVMDGWWAEAYRPGLGWAIGRANLDDPADVQDAFDAESLYSLLEEEVAPAFYERDSDGVPRTWVAMMKASMTTFAPQYSTHRMVSEYATGSYVPAGLAWRRLTGQGLAGAREAAAHLRRLEAGWPGLRVVSIEGGPSDTDASAPLTVTVATGALSSSDVRVDAVLGAVRDGHMIPTATTALACDETGEGYARFTGRLAAARGGSHGFAIRVMPNVDSATRPEDSGLVLWA